MKNLKIKINSKHGRRPARLNKAVMAAIAFVAITAMSPKHACADIVEREDAEEMMVGETPESVAGVVERWPEVGERLVIWERARPIGDDPRVFAACAWIIEKSTNPISVRIAVSGISTLLLFHREKIPKDRDAAIHAALRKALKYDDSRIQHEVALALEALGPEYESEIDTLYKDWLTKARGRTRTIAEQVKEVGCYRLAETLPMCEEILAKSTAPVSIRNVLSSIDYGRRTHNELFIKRKAIPAVISMLDEFAHRTDVHISDRSRAVEILGLLHPEWVIFA